MWMPDIMHPSESSDNYAFDALGLCSDMQYNELFDLVVDSNGYNENFSELKVSEMNLFEEGPTMLCPGAGLDSANSCGSSAGPDDQHVRSREESWPAALPLTAHPHPPPPSASPSLAAPPTAPVWEIRGTPTKTMHMHIPARYKGQSLSGLPGTNDLPDPLVRIPGSRHRASTSLSSPTSFSPAPITGVKNTTISEASQTNSGNSCTPTKGIHRTLRHRKSTRDLRRAQLTELMKSSMAPAKMINQQQHHITSGNPIFDEILQYSPAHNSSQPMGRIPSDVPRYTPSNASPRLSSVRSEYMRSSFSLSAENLHTPQYEQVTLARPHSMSSLGTTSVMPDNVALQFTLRRASDPTDSAILYENQTTRQFSLEEYAPWMAAGNMDQQSFDSSIELTIPTESPVAESDTSQTWWEESKVNMEDDWATQQLSGVTLGQTNDAPNPTIHHHNNGSSRQSPYNPMLFPHQPPSPSFEEEESNLFPHSIKRPASSCSSMPSPPGSPEFYFPSQMPTPEIGFPPTPSLGQGGFNCVYSQGPPSIGVVTRRFSLPHTPSPSSHVSATAAAAVAIAATSRSSKSISKSSSRPGPSRRKASSGSMRSQAKISVASSLSSQSNDSEMSFVNFTPNDATRILSGVAPSGSSKTKARREREALEKRRKLSEAAAAAVTAAGGDASALAVDLL